MSSNSATLRPADQADVDDSSSRPTAPIVPAPKKSGRTRTIIFTFLGIAVIVWGVRFGLHAYHYETTDDAYISGHMHRISSQVNGIVKEVRVEENQVVKAGDVIAVLDPREFQIAIDRARGSLAQAHAQQAEAKAAAAQADAQFTLADARRAQAEAQLQQVKAQVELARVTLDRVEQLTKENVGAATQADLDNARSSYDAARASAVAAESNIAASKASVTAASATRDAAAAQAEAAEAAVTTAQAAIRDAELQFSYTTIVAPVSGRIGNKAVESGNRIQAGQGLFALASPEMWVTANFKETQLAHMHSGQPVEITVDAIPGEKLTGQVESISPASGAQFALLPPDNATGNFNKVVQRVPVKIVFEPAELQRLGDRLRLGLSVVPDVRVR